MEDFLRTIAKNPFSKECLAPFTNETWQTDENLWGAGLRVLNPPKLVTAWLSMKDPLMLVAGAGYRATEVRDRTFDLQKEAGSIRGNRKLTKAKVGDALGAAKPNADQTKIIAAVLYAIKHVQTVCFDQEKKTVWTVPEDLRSWTQNPIIWIDSRFEQMLDWSSLDAKEMSMSSWLLAREAEGWAIDWPIADGTFEEIKERAAAMDVKPRCLEPGGKVKKEDWAKALGRAEAVRHLASLTQ